MYEVVREMVVLSTVELDVLSTIEEVDEVVAVAATVTTTVLDLVTVTAVGI
jgi:hypothetical protein